MKREILYITFFIVFLSLIFNGCSKEPDNIAVSADGVEIVFNHKGEGELALLFVHGWSNDKSLWDLQIENFSKKYSVMAVDLTGFGESGNNRENWTIQNFANDVAAVVNEVDPKHVVLVGFSMGAPVAIEAAIKLPGKAIGVVLVDGLKNIEMKIPPEKFSQIESSLMDFVTNPTKEKLVKGGFFKKNIDENYEHVLSMLKNNPKIGWKESIRNTFLWQNENCTESLSKIQVPVVAINSDRNPTNVEAFKKYVPSFEADIISNTGHVVFWDEPEIFNSLLQERIQDFVNNKN